jgi:phasin family protein
MFKIEDTSKLGKETMDSVLASYATATKGLQAIATETADYSKKSFEAGVAHFEQLASAKSIEAAFQLQTAFAKTVMEGYVAEMTKLAEMYSTLAKDAYKPVEATAQKATATVKASVEKAAAAA